MATVQHIGQSKNIGGMNFEIIGGWGQIIRAIYTSIPLFRHPGTRLCWCTIILLVPLNYFQLIYIIILKFQLKNFAGRSKVALRNATSSIKLDNLFHLHSYWQFITHSLGIFIPEGYECTSFNDFSADRFTLVCCFKS